MKSIFIKLLVVMSFFWLFGNSDVLAIDCYYQSSDGEEIKITIGNNNLNGYLFVEPNSSTGIGFAAANNLVKWGNSIYSLLNSGYYDNEEHIYTEACPLSFTNYYINSPFDTYISYNLSTETDSDSTDRMPIIKFSNTACNDVEMCNNVENQYKLYIDGDLEENSNRNFIINKNNTIAKDVEIFNSGGPIDDTQNIKYRNYKLEINKTFSQLENTDDYLECFYKNTEGLKMKFHFYHKTGQHRYWISKNSEWPLDDGKYAGIRDDNRTFYSCPTTVYFTDNVNFSVFTTPNTCDAEDTACYYREDLEFEYSGNASKVITYYDTTNSNSTIKIKVLKIPDNDGKEYKIVLNDNKEISHVNEMSEYYDILKFGTSDTYPGYIYEKNGSYTISKSDPNTYKQEYKTKNPNATDQAYDKVYMLGLGMLEIQGFGGDKIEATCKSMFDDSFVNLVKRNFFRLIYIGVPILLLVLTTFDFAQVVFVDDKDGIQNAFKKFKKRLVVAVLIYFVPVILNTLIDIVGVDKVGECIKTFTELK